VIAGIGSRAVGRILVSYGVGGILVFVLSLALIVRPLASLADLAGERAQAVEWLDNAGQILDQASQGATDAGTSVTSAAAAARNAASLSDQLAASMTALGKASNLTILGSQPLAGLAGQFANVATRAQGLSASMSSLASSLDQNTTDFTALTSNLTSMHQQVLDLETALAGPSVLDTMGPWLAPLAVLICAWITLPAVASLYLGIRLIRA
jgi:hypothetical protein